MRLTRYLTDDRIKLELDTKMDAELDPDINIRKYKQQKKEAVLRELADLLYASGRVSNKSKFYTDLLNREKKATTAIGDGIAVPHVRTVQAKELIMAFARCSEGVEFDSPDGKPVHFFFAIVCPPYDDRVYLKIYKEIGGMLNRDDVKERLLQAKSTHEIYRLIDEATR